MKWWLIAQAAVDGEPPPADNTSFMIMMFGMVAVLCVVMFRRSRKQQQQQAQADSQNQLLKQAALAKQELLKKQEPFKAEYSKEYEQRKITIGTIKCTQCEWSGQWGTGMTYEQFFAGNLADAGIDVGRREVNNDNLSRDNRQYTCPVCNSSDWKTV
jgi:Na+-transporting NADH:ubiquinone oxidoreductase subunit NqrC